MGGHGGLNILPQKRWNVYNFDNREKVRKDEEEAAKEEQLKREQSRKRDTEFRIEQLRQARGLASSSRQGTTNKAAESPEPKEKATETKSKHINLFEGIRIFDPVDDKNNNNKRESIAGRGATSDNKNKRAKKEEPKVVSAEDEKYRLGYGIAGKGVKLPWYLMEKQQQPAAHHNDSSSDTTPVTDSSKNKKKSVAELREERLKRETREKARQQALLLKHPHRSR